jgi:AraC-like DNA-binding protein
MLHHELLRRLCLARDWLRTDEEPRQSVNEIARRAGIAPHHFIRLFKAVFGETPHQYRSLAQIERAKHLLVLTDQTVTEICMAVGFSSLGSFSALFTRRVGVSPSAFQRRYRPVSGRLGQLPADLIPGCFSLMAGFPQEKAISKKPVSRRPDKIAAILS